MKRILFFAVLRLCLASETHAQVVKNPVNDFLDTITRTNKDDLYEFAVPNRSGGKSILLANSAINDTNPVCGWIIYAPVKGGYKRLDQGLGFRLSPLSVGKFPMLKGSGLLVYYGGPNDQGKLIGYVFDGEKTREVDLGDFHACGKDKIRFNKLFSKSKHPRIKKTLASHLPPQVRQRLPDAE